MTKAKAKAITKAAPKATSKKATAINEPKYTEVAQDLSVVREILTGGNEKLSPFGHKLVSDSGKMDVMILQGVCTLSALTTVVGTSKTSKVSRISEQAKARRVRNHIMWMADTAGKKGKGVDSRLKNVYGAEATKIGKAIAGHLRKFADHINAVYAAEYGRRAVKAK